MTDTSLGDSQGRDSSIDEPLPPGWRAPTPESGPMIRCSGKTRRYPGRTATRAEAVSSALQQLALRSEPRIDPVEFLCNGGLARQLEPVAPLVGRIASCERADLR